MRYEWTDGKRALALEDGNLFERGLTVEEAGQEEWLFTDVTRAQSAVFRELLRLAERVLGLEAAYRSSEGVRSSLVDRVHALEEENRRLRDALESRVREIAEGIVEAQRKAHVSAVPFSPPLKPPGSAA